MLCVVKALGVVPRWGVVGAPVSHLLDVIVDFWLCKAPVNMVHHVQCGRNIFVEFWLRHVVRHVVQEINVPERPPGEIFGLRSHLEILNIEIERSAKDICRHKIKIERPAWEIWRQKIENWRRRKKIGLTSWSDLRTHLFQHLCPAVMLSWDNNFVHVQKCYPIISVYKISKRGKKL